jgi:hypothetical protein
MKINFCKMLLCFFFLIAGVSSAQKWNKMLNLRGYWKFSIGDDMKWAKPEFDDRSWEEMRVPGSWQNEGFHGYHGYAWYRKHFKYTPALNGRSIVLRIGRIDDADQVYLNGHLIGFSGSMPPTYQTAWNAWREYSIPEKYLETERENVIAVRVYDSELDAGIVEGEIGLFENRDGMDLTFNLAGIWKFTTGDDLKWREQRFDDKEWDDIMVPSAWDSQGYKDYDGYGWYRLTEVIPASIVKERLVLVLGKIDDIDEAYVNGKLIGSTGDMKLVPEEFNRRNEYQQFRGYFIPDGLLIPNKENTIAVRVYDGYNIGGIYEGPVGFIEQSKYAQYWREKKREVRRNKNWNFWNFIFNE